MISSDLAHKVALPVQEQVQQVTGDAIRFGEPAQSSGVAGVIRRFSSLTGETRKAGESTERVVQVLSNLKFAKRDGTTPLARCLLMEMSISARLRSSYASVRRFKNFRSFGV
tara:strand:- start:617 stop:952 length:336 start_codon:yes stop_codon:yes gene_type:complete